MQVWLLFRYLAHTWPDPDRVCGVAEIRKKHGIKVPSSSSFSEQARLVSQRSGERGSWPWLKKASEIPRRNDSNVRKHKAGHTCEVCIICHFLPLIIFFPVNDDLFLCRTILKRLFGVFPGCWQCFYLPQGGSLFLLLSLPTSWGNLCHFLCTVRECCLLTQNSKRQKLEKKSVKFVWLMVYSVLF